MLGSTKSLLTVCPVLLIESKIHLEMPQNAIYIVDLLVMENLVLLKALLAVR